MSGTTDAPRSAFALVGEFTAATGGTIGLAPGDPGPEVTELRSALLEEEHREVQEALSEGDVPHIARELADLIYVTCGTALAYGIDLPAVVAEVHRANMAKLSPDGTLHMRPDGKVLKPSSWSPPDVDGVLALQEPESIMRACTVPHQEVP